VETVTIIDEPAMKDKDSRHRMIVVDDVPIAGIWYNKNRPPMPPGQTSTQEAEATAEEILKGNKKKRGNHTHGKRAYSHVTSDVVDKLNNEKAVGNIVNQQAALFALSKHIEWGTGRLIKARKDRKGRRNMQLKDIEKAIKRSAKTTKQIVNDLMANGIIEIVDGEYFFMNGLISKGRKEK
jgi:hypothetical protein